jgi:hypothetical protein
VPGRYSACGLQKDRILRAGEDVLDNITSQP